MKSKSRRATSFISRTLHKLPYKLNYLGALYDKHTRLFNDGIIELLCLTIANAFVWSFSYLGFIQTSLVAMNLIFATPITFFIKYVAHRNWVWK